MKTKSLLLVLLLVGTVISCDNSKGITKERTYGTTRRYQTPTPQKDLEIEVDDDAVTNSTVKTELKKDKKRLNEMPVLQEIMYEENDVEDDVFYCKTEEIQDNHNTNEYDFIKDNDYLLAKTNPLSTFSIDVDNAAYSVVRQYLNRGVLPPKDAVRVEEMINYFDYHYAQPAGEHPFSVFTEVASAPWNSQHQLVMVGINGKDLDFDNIKPSNLVFLIDTSGSMSDNNKLPLLKKSFKVLLNNLPENSKVAIVAYAGSAGLVLPSTSVKEKKKILRALNRLSSGGSTAGGAGIKLAYKIAFQNYKANGNNRVILATDGDFNVGASSSSEMVRLIQKQKEKDIYLSILGFGMGNYKDGRMEQISNAGNGNYFYIDNYSEALKVFKKDLLANMFTIAKDVKIQVEFNPAKVKAYRLIGYVNRKMANKDFNDDTKDAGELGPGHTVTALYELVPAGSSEKINGTDDLKYQKVQIDRTSSELLTVKLRYKPIKSNKSKLIKIPVLTSGKEWKQASKDYQFAASVAGFGMLLRDSKYKGNTSPKLLRELAWQSKDYNDKYKNEYITLIDRYEEIVSQKPMVDNQ
jgi:Ca-activated chloride channel family protein